MVNTWSLFSSFSYPSSLPLFYTFFFLVKTSVLLHFLLPSLSLVCYQLYTHSQRPPQCLFAWSAADLEENQDSLRAQAFKQVSSHGLHGTRRMLVEGVKGVEGARVSCLTRTHARRATGVLFVRSSDEPVFRYQIFRSMIFVFSSQAKQAHICSCSRLSDGTIPFSRFLLLSRILRVSQAIYFQSLSTGF